MKKELNTIKGKEKDTDIINESNLDVDNKGTDDTSVEPLVIDNQAQESAPVHKRRVRYKGTHPRTFEEKYKEHNPENMQIQSLR